MKKLLLALSILNLTACDFLNPQKSKLIFSAGNKETAEIERIETDAKYLELKKTLFDTSCIKCHNPKSAETKGRLDLTKKDEITANFDDIVYRMTDAFDTGMDYMPPKGNRVSPELIKELKSWNNDREFANIKKTIFEASCIKCHNPQNAKRIDLTSKDVILNKYDDILFRMTDAFEQDGKKPMPPVGKAPRVSEVLIKELKIWKEKQ